jgi:hypothetical protein
MPCHIDDNGAGSYARALRAGAGRFCTAYPAEEWTISGVLVQHGLSLNANDEKRYLRQKVLPPVLDMEGSVFEALDAFRNEG